MYKRSKFTQSPKNSQWCTTVNVCCSLLLFVQNKMSWVKRQKLKSCGYHVISVLSRVFSTIVKKTASRLFYLFCKHISQKHVHISSRAYTFFSIAQSRNWAISWFCNGNKINISHSVFMAFILDVVKTIFLVSGFCTLLILPHAEAIIMKTFVQFCTSRYELSANVFCIIHTPYLLLVCSCWHTKQYTHTRFYIFMSKRKEPFFCDYGWKTSSYSLMHRNPTWNH